MFPVSLETNNIKLRLIDFTVSIFIVLISSPGCTAWEEKDCTGSDMQHCMSPFNRYLNRSHEVLLFPNYDVPTMHDLCRDYETVTHCLSEIKYHCKEIVQAVLTGLDESYSFICSAEGLAVYNRTEDCLARPSLQEEGQKCISHFRLKSAHVAITKALGGNAYEEEFCRVANSYLNCLHDAIKIECGDEAARWQDNVIKDAIRETLQLFDCRIDGEWTEGEIIFVSVMIGTILMISAAPLIMHVYRKLLADRSLKPGSKEAKAAAVVVPELPGDLIKEEGSAKGFENVCYEHGGNSTMTL